MCSFRLFGDLWLVVAVTITVVIEDGSDDGGDDGDDQWVHGVLLVLVGDDVDDVPQVTRGVREWGTRRGRERDFGDAWDTVHNELLISCFDEEIMRQGRLMQPSSEFSEQMSVRTAD